MAFLSYSTKGSGKGPGPDLARNACAKCKEMLPDIPVDGEMQFDAAVSPEVGQLKFPGSPVAGYANTFSPATSVIRSHSVSAVLPHTAPSCRV